MQMDESAVSLWSASLGDAVKKAKSTISDVDARRAYILFGIPPYGGYRDRLSKA